MKIWIYILYDLKFLTGKYLASFQTPQSCKVLDMSKWAKHSAETIGQTLAGCFEQCPFCGEQCEETSSNHLMINIVVFIINKD